MDYGRTHELYRYEPLPHKRSIRLMELLPGKRSQGIRCRLQTFRIDECPAYEAISYVWGSPSPKAHVLCHDENGHQGLIEVPISLSHCLRRLRFESAPRTLWADSICINQQDLDERSHQVQIMGSVFERAECVIAWFGQGKRYNVRAAFELLKSLALKYQHHTDRDAFSPSAVATYQSDAEQLLDRWSHALTGFLNNQWFKRGWVLQEIGLARRGLVVCGRHEIPWHDVVHAFKYIQRHHPEARYRHRLNTLSVHNIHSMGFQDDSLSMGRILETMRAFKTSDPKDRVYALLAHKSFQGAQRCNESMRIPVDYNLSHTQVYLETARFVLEHEPPLELLGSVRHTRETWDGCDRRISWLPQWDVPKLSYSLYKRVSYQAAKDTKPHISQTGLKLKARGLGVDQIEWQSDVFRRCDLRSAEKERREYEPLTDALNHVTHARGVAETVSEALERFCRVLYAGFLMHSGADVTRNLSEGGRMSDFVAFLMHTGVHLESLPGLRRQHGVGEPWRFVEAIAPIKARRFFITRNGYFGISPEVSLPGDRICVFFGGANPFILRPEACNEYRVCGPSYVHGLMDGEAIDTWESGNLQVETFTMV